MFRKKVIPALYALFAVLSLLILKSLAQSVVISQLVFFLLGAVIILIFSHIPYKFLERWSWIYYILLLMSLLFLLIEGTVTRGSKGWFSFFNLFNVQPSQLAIPVVLIIINKLVLTSKKINIIGVIKFLLLLGLPSILILFEPDFGTTIILIVTLGSVLWLSPISNKIIFSLLSGAVILAICCWILVLQDYQKLRITNFIFSHADSTTNYNAYQALVAVGSGQLVGKGLGQGIQSQLKFLPEKHTDFIFAALGEETGFLGGIFVIGIYSFLVIFLGFVGERSTRESEKYFCWGVASMFAIQTSINIGMNIGLFPITGITLPLLSYGGSSILALSGMLGIVQNIIQNQHKKAIMVIE